MEPDLRHVTLPRLGTIRTHESTRALERRLQAGTARVLSATVRQERGRWFVAFHVETRRDTLDPTRPEIAVGVDVGIKHLAVSAASDGEVRYEANPAHLQTALSRLRRASRVVARRRGSDRKKGTPASRRWEKANLQRNRIRHRVANLRADALHQFTSRVRRKTALSSSRI
ncbi:transposase [Nocardia sp. SYP-A9097]|uniref:transposase n=1 Tax=Nocardia sp. SYP-A9097 TaxID=2663237 RepID=UPI0028155EAB|nr:transposase [Nocardia sp. SYP-A9097]